MIVISDTTPIITLLKIIGTIGLLALSFKKGIRTKNEIISLV